MNVGSILKELRGRRGLLQGELASILGYTKQNMSYMEKDDSNITVKSLLAILTELNCSLKIIDDEDQEEFKVESKEGSKHNLVSD